MISGERKKFGLKSARVPALLFGLSNTVIVIEDGAPKYCHIAFDHSFVDTVGKHLSRGVSNRDPANIQVTLQNMQWVVTANYVYSKEQQVLWASDTRPTWLKELKTIGNKNDNSATTKTRSTGQSSIVHADTRATATSTT